MYEQREQMLGQFCPTALDCYEAPSRQRGGLSAVGLGLVVIVALLLGVLPPAVLDGNRAAHWAWVAEVCVLVASAIVLRRRRSDLGSRRVLLLLLSLLLWVGAPFAGVAGVFLLRLPMIQIVLLTLIQRQVIQRAAGRFPAQID